MSARIRNYLLVSVALILCAVFVAVTAGKIAAVATPKARLVPSQNGDVSVRELAPASPKSANSVRQAAPAADHSAQKTATAPATADDATPANAKETKPAN